MVKEHYMPYLCKLKENNSIYNIIQSETNFGTPKAIQTILNKI